jgi:TonB family protein
MPFPPRSPRFPLSDFLGSIFLNSMARRLVSSLRLSLPVLGVPVWSMRVLLAPVLLLPLFVLAPVVSGDALPLLQENPANPPVAQQAAPIQPAQAQPSQTPPAPAQPASSAPAAEFAPVTEADLQRRLVGKQLFLRGGWLGDSLSFTEHGDPVGHPAVGSFTLSAIQIDKVHLTKHRVEFEGSRYALHFLGALPYEDSANAVDRIRITPKKKTLKITIDREIVLKSRKVSKAEKAAEKASKQNSAAASAGQPAGKPVTSSESDAPAAAQAQAANAPAQAQPTQGESAADLEPDKPGEAAAADQASVTTTVSPAHAALILHQALDKIFATGLDEGMRARMPEFWQLYYQAQAAGADYRPKDPGVLRASAVDQQAKLLAFVAPASNDYAQSNAIAGPALYRVVVGSDGVPQQIAVERPIGFGLDENAVAALRKASFQPAIKGGQPVSEALDLTVVFHIYSQRTSQSSRDAGSQASSGAGTLIVVPTVKPALPGPYSARPAPAQPAADQPQPDQPQPDQAQPNQTQPDQAQPDQAQPDPAKPNPAKPN